MKKKAEPALSNKDNFSLKQFDMDIRTSFYQMQSVLKKRRRGSEKPLIRIYTGGAMSVGLCHSGCFDTAMETVQLLEQGWEIERLNVSIIRATKKEWCDDPKYLVDWLLNADIHVILCQ